MKPFLLYGFGLLCSLSVMVACKKSDTTAIPTTTGEYNGPSQASGVTITDFSPKTGFIGTRVIITGTGFGTDRYAIKVAVGNSAFDYPVAVTPTTMVIQTSSDTPIGKISVSSNLQIVTSKDEFAPKSEISYLDGDARLGRLMAFHGQGFGSDTNKISISFGGTAPVKPHSISGYHMSMQTYIPRYAQEGKVTVTVNGVTHTLDTVLKFNTCIKDFSPKTFSSGDTVTITGFGFTDTKDMSVGFNTTTGSIQRPFKVTPNEMSVIVPSNAISGKFEVGRTYSSMSDISPSSYTFIPRVYFNNVFTPTAGKVNDLIRINGDFTGADITKIDVSFGGSKTVKPAYITGPDIYVRVPADAKTGKITILRTGYAPFTGSFTFTVIP